MEEEKESNERKNKIQPNEMKEFVIGILLLSVGLFMLAMRVRVHGGFWGYGFRLWGNFNLPTGTVVIPLIIGVVWYFMNSKSIAAKVIIVLGSIFIVTSIIMSVSITFTGANLFEYILMLVLSAAGLGLILKTALTDKHEKK